MTTTQIIIATLAIVILIDGLLLTLFPEQIKRTIREMFKSRKKIVKIGLIEIILALLVLFLMSLK